MENIEKLTNIQVTVSSIIGVMVKILMVLLLVLAMVMVRQSALMDKVVKLPVGNKVKLLTWSYFGLMIVLTAIVILV
jgi:hypothetical protein